MFQRFPGDISHKVHVYSTHFMDFAGSEGNTDKLKRWLRRAGDIFEKKLLIFPCHTMSHWSLLVVVNPGKMMQTYKSYWTYKPINLMQKPPQPGGPVGASGFLSLRHIKRIGRWREFASYVISFAPGRIAENHVVSISIPHAISDILLHPRSWERPDRFLLPKICWTVIRLGFL